jgi:hypothetical protein
MKGLYLINPAGGSRFQNHLVFFRASSLSEIINVTIKEAIDVIASALDRAVIDQDNAANRQKAKGAARPLRKIR